jgi:hypothetical protein
MHITAEYLLTVFIYVAYRSNNPSEETVKEAMKELQKNKIDIKQLVKFPRDHCANGNRQRKEEILEGDTGV